MQSRTSRTSSGADGRKRLVEGLSLALDFARTRRRCRTSGPLIADRVAGRVGFGDEEADQRMHDEHPLPEDWAEQEAERRPRAALPPGPLTYWSQSTRWTRSAPGTSMCGLPWPTGTVVCSVITQNHL